jgi:hypothetical protein
MERLSENELDFLCFNATCNESVRRAVAELRDARTQLAELQNVNSDLRARFNAAVGKLEAARRINDEHEAAFVKLRRMIDAAKRLHEQGKPLTEASVMREMEPRTCDGCGCQQSPN